MKIELPLTIDRQLHLKLGIYSREGAASFTKPSASPAFSKGDKVELVGLQNSLLNHRVGVIVGELLENGLYPVELPYSLAYPSKEIAVKPDNLKKIVDDAPHLGIGHGVGIWSLPGLYAQKAFSHLQKIDLEQLEERQRKLACALQKKLDDDHNTHTM